MPGPMSNDVVMEFLELYRGEPILWDPKHPSHKNRNLINDAWLRIQNELSVTYSVTDLKKKKESLMTSFRLHFNKKKKQESYMISWFAYPLMESFLSEKYECDSSTNQNEPDYFGSSTVYSHSNLSQDERQVKMEERSKISMLRKSLEGNNKFRGNDPASNILYAKQQMDDAVTCLKRASSGSKKDQDEYDLYGQLLAKKLRKLDERQRDVAMHEIDNIMFRAKMQPERPPRSFSTSPVNKPINSPVFVSINHNQIEQYDPTTLHYEDQTDGPP